MSSATTQKKRNSAQGAKQGNNISPESSLALMEQLREKIKEDNALNANEGFPYYVTRQSTRFALSQPKFFKEHPLDIQPENVKHFIRSAKALHTKAMDTFYALSVNPRDSAALETLTVTLPNDHAEVTQMAMVILENNFGKSPQSGSNIDWFEGEEEEPVDPTGKGLWMSAPISNNIFTSIDRGTDKEATNKSQQAHAAAVINSILNGTEPVWTADIELLSAVFSSVDIGTGVTQAASAFNNILTTLTAMMNDLIAQATYFTGVYNDVKSTTQAHADSTNPAQAQGLSTVDWETSNFIGKNPIDNVTIQSPGNVYRILEAVKGTPYTFAFDVSSPSPPMDSVYINSSTMPMPSGNVDSSGIPVLQGALFYDYTQDKFYVSPKAIMQMVQQVSAGLAGIIQEQTGENGGLAASWERFAYTDATTSAASQAFSSTVSTLSQKASQTTNGVNLVLTSITSLFSQLQSMLSGSGTTRNSLAAV